MIEFRVLGSFEVVGQDGPLTLGAPMQRALLAVLVVHRGEAVSSERLVDELWGGQPPASATKLVQGYVSKLRKVLGDGLLVTQGRGYLLRIPPGQLDVDRFESLVALGRHALVENDALTAAARLREALQVWRGRPFADFSYESFAQARIARLEEDRLSALEERIDADLTLGGHRRVVGELEALTIEQPTCERLAGQLMLALYRCGRRADALQVYQRARARLAAELGLQPGPALRALQIQILEHDGGLAPRDPNVALEGSVLSEDERVSADERAFVEGAQLWCPPALATPTVGRERGTGEIVELLSSRNVRLVTLTGPGGVGKTKLALEIAHTVGSRFDDGVCWVELARVARAGDVWATIASALDLRSVRGESVEDAVRRHLAGRDLLLVIDNFEHVLGGAGVVGELLGACPGLTILTTSRAALNLAAEHQLHVAPLAAPVLSDTVSVAEIEATTAGPSATGKGVLLRPATMLIGREQELEVVCGLLGDPDARLVTLTGPGGVGKTRLALEALHALESSFRDGVCWVELAGVARPDDVGPAVARALAATPLQGENALETLRRHLTGRRLLLAIDNFDHVLEAAELMAELHGTCPELSLLVTSREALNLAAEHRVIIAPLAVPAPEAATLGELEAIAGSALFLAAARRRDSRFAVSTAAAPAIARICARLDGLPLALELAAARTELFGPDELAARLGDAVTDLGVGPRDGPERQRTLHATIEWSYRMLDEGLQRAFIDFAVFAGGATLEAVRAVSGAELRSVEALIAKSLIYRRGQPDGATRLLMLETIRQYALGQLAADPERHAIYRRHCEHYLQLVEQAVPRLSTLDEQRALAVLDADIDNIRSALQWSLRAAPEISLRLAGQLGNYWRMRPDLDGPQWLGASLEAAGARAPLIDRARARLHHANALRFRNQGAASIDGLREATALYRQADDHAGISETLSSLAVSVGIFAGDLAGERRYALQACHHARIAGNDALLGRALGKLAAVSGDERRAILEQATGLLIPLGDYREVARAYSSAAYMALTEDSVAEAISFLESGLQAVKSIEDPIETTIILTNIGLARLFAGDLDPARDAFERALALCAQHVFRRFAGEGLAGLAAVAAAQGCNERAARLRGAARGLGYPPAPVDKPIDDRLERDYLAAARTRYGDVAWRDGEQTGERLSPEQAIAYALGERTTTPSPTKPRRLERLIASAT